MNRIDATFGGAGDGAVAPPIVTPRLRLRNFTGEDFGAVHRYASDPRVTATLCWGPNSAGQTRAFLAAASQETTTNPRCSYSLGIEETSGGGIIGGIGLRPREEKPGTFELGYCLRPDYWGAGLATEAVAAITALGFERLGARRIVAEVFVSNARSGRILEKLGFRPGGPFQRHVTCRDEHHDARLFTLDQRAWRQASGE